MRKPVTSRTIAAISSGQHRDPNPQTPSVSDVLAEIRRRNPSAADALERHVLYLPRGFELAPVLYAPVPKEKKLKLEFEYKASVRRDFKRFLAATRADDLRALGICESGLVRMRAGYHPANAQGVRYPLDIDHIVERGGSQISLGCKEAVDQENPYAEGRKTHLVNHFSNLILLPLSVHAYKNRLAQLQNITLVPEGGQRWVLMLVPDARTRYVAPPQPLGQEALLALQSALDYPVVRVALDAAKGMADCHGPQSVQPLQAVTLKTVADRYGWNSDDCRVMPVQDIFLSMIAYNLDAGRFVNNVLRPALSEVSARLAEIDANPKLDRAARLGILRHPRFIAFCVEASRYPLAEAAQVLRDYRCICNKTQKMPANNNTRNRKPPVKGPRRS